MNFFSKLIVLPWIRIQIGPRSWIQVQCIWIHNTGPRFDLFGVRQFTFFFTLFLHLFLVFPNCFRNVNTVDRNQFRENEAKKKRNTWTAVHRKSPITKYRRFWPHAQQSFNIKKIEVTLKINIFKIGRYFPKTSKNKNQKENWIF